MRLAKQHLDIGLFTNRIEPQCAFWSNEVGLRLDHVLTLRRGWVQHRFDANGSVIKVNHRTTRLPVRPMSGFSELSVARTAQPAEWAGRSPDGDRVRVVLAGTRDVVGIGISISTPRPKVVHAFYRDVLQFDDGGDGRLWCGDSVVDFVEGPGGSDIDDFARRGYRYLTMQVFDADREIAAIVDRGGRVAREAVNLGGVARYGFVADPDGNWTEISARTSLTGVAVE